MEPDRRAVVDAYVRHYEPPSNPYLEPDAASAHALAIIRKVRKDVPNAPFYQMVDISAMLPEPQEDELFGFINPFDKLVQAKVSGFCLSPKMVFFSVRPT